MPAELSAPTENPCKELPPEFPLAIRLPLRYIVEAVWLKVPVQISKLLNGKVIPDALRSMLAYIRIVPRPDRPNVWRTPEFIESKTKPRVEPESVSSDL